MTRNPHHPMTAQVLAAVQLISRKPRSATELAGLLGCSPATTAKYISLMLAEGLVTHIGYEKQSSSGPAVPMYAWVSVEAEA